MSKFTHYGWFSFCPVYIADPYTNNPTLRSRRVWMQPLLKLAVAVQSLAIGVCTMMNPDWIPTWKIKITGKVS